MKIKKTSEEHYAILYLSGEFDTFYVPKLLSEMDQLVQTKIYYAVIDLRLVEFMNSTALGALLIAQKKVKEKGGDLVIARPSVFCKEILTRVGLDRLLKIFPTEEAAVEHLNSLYTEQGPIYAKAAKGMPKEFLQDEANVLMAFVDPAKHDAVGGHAVGRISRMRRDSIVLKWDGGRAGLKPEQINRLLTPGTELRVKFRIPLFKKEFFENITSVNSVQVDKKGMALIDTNFGPMEKEEAEAVGRFLEDMKFLQSELKKATE